MVINARVSPFPPRINARVSTKSGRPSPPRINARVSTLSGRPDPPRIKDRLSTLLFFPFFPLFCDKYLHVVKYYVCNRCRSYYRSVVPKYSLRVFKT